MGIVIGPVLRRADGYRFDTWNSGKGVTRGYPYRRIEDAYYARRADIKASAQGRALAGDRLPDPGRVHRGIHRLRDACRRLIGLASWAFTPSHWSAIAPIAYSSTVFRWYDKKTQTSWQRRSR